MNARAFLIKCLANKSVPQVARDLGVRSDQMADWVKGTHKIYSKAARNLGRYFHVGPENFMNQWYEIKEPENEDEEFGNEIRRWRLRMGLSMTDLAIRLGYCQKSISNWESGYNLTEIRKNELRLLLESVESNLPEIF